jgi:predicted transcriptional regulator with HTH domain
MPLRSDSSRTAAMDGMTPSYAGHQSLDQVGFVDLIGEFGEHDVVMPCSCVSIS